MMNNRLGCFLVGVITLCMLPPVMAAEADDGGIWIDVRPQQEYRKGHIEGAINIPHGDIGHKISDFVEDTSMPVHLYGETGVMAGLALEILMEMGFDYVVNEGAYEAILARQQNSQEN